VILLSDLLEARIVDEDGESLGHVHDVRVRRLERRNSDGRQLRVLGLVTGRRGIRERLGIDTGRTPGPTVEREFIEWERVVEVDAAAGTVTVRAE
jgi:hypothetical protein